MEQNQTPAPVNAPVTPPSTKRASYGGIAAIVLILALIIVGAFYVWGERIATHGNLSPAEQEMLKDLETQGESSDASAIEADLAAENPDEFNEDFDAAYAELDAAFEAE